MMARAAMRAAVVALVLPALLLHSASAQECPPAPVVQHSVLTSACTGPARQAIGAQSQIKDKSTAARLMHVIHMAHQLPACVAGSVHTGCCNSWLPALTNSAARSKEVLLRLLWRHRLFNLQPVYKQEHDPTNLVAALCHVAHSQLALRG